MQLAQVNYLFVIKIIQKSEIKSHAGIKYNKYGDFFYNSILHIETCNAI